MPRWCVLLAAAWCLARLGPAAAAPVPPPNRPVIEVVFCVDVTRDMAAALDSLRRHFLPVCQRWQQGRPPPRLRVGVVAYRDRGDAFVTRVLDLTEDVRRVQVALDELQADGGGDEPEGVNQALHEARFHADDHLVSGTRPTRRFAKSQA